MATDLNPDYTSLNPGKFINPLLLVLSEITIVGNDEGNEVGGALHIARDPKSGPYLAAALVGEADGVIPTDEVADGSTGGIGVVHNADPATNFDAAPITALTTEDGDKILEADLSTVSAGIDVFLASMDGRLFRVRHAASPTGDAVYADDSGGGIVLNTELAADVVIQSDRARSLHTVTA
jgi:hypothetical protein